MTSPPDFLPVGDARNNMVNAMIEFKHVSAEADSFNAREYKDVLSSIIRTDNTISESELDSREERLKHFFFRIQKNFSKSYHQIKNIPHGFAGSVYVKWLTGEGKFDTNEKYVLVSRKTETMLNQDTLLNICKVRLNKVTTKNQLGNSRTRSQGGRRWLYRFSSSKFKKIVECFGRRFCWIL